jgi:hypothetical protein
MGFNRGVEARGAGHTKQNTGQKPDLRDWEIGVRAGMRSCFQAGQKARHGSRLAMRSTVRCFGLRFHHYALANTHGALAGSIGVVAAPLHGLRLARDTPWLDLPPSNVMAALATHRHCSPLTRPVIATSSSGHPPIRNGRLVSLPLPQEQQPH